MHRENFIDFHSKFSILSERMLGSKESNNFFDRDSVDDGEPAKNFLKCGLGCGIFCIILVSLLVVGINGGSMYVGLTYDNATCYANSITMPLHLYLTIVGAVNMAVWFIIIDFWEKVN